MKILPFFFLLMAASFFQFSCQKTERAEIENSGITHAKNWFSATVLVKENPVLPRMSKLAEKLNWPNANTGLTGQLEYVIVPLEEDLKLKANYFMKRAFIFYKKAGGRMQMEIVELLAKGQPVDNPVQLASVLFERKIMPAQSPVQTQDVQAFFYNKEYGRLDAYKVNKGQWQPLRASAVSKQNDKQLATESDGSGDCREWGVYVVTRDQYGNVLDEQLIYTYWTGDCSGGAGAGNNPNDEPGETMGGTSEAEEYDLHAEAALLIEALSTKISPQEKTITYTSTTATKVPFQWIVVENQFGAWKVLSSDIAEGYNSANTGPVLYKIEHQGSAISGLTQWGRIRRDGRQGVPFINLSWNESANSSTIASDYRSGTVNVSGILKNLGLGFPGNSYSNHCKIRLQ